MTLGALFMTLGALLMILVALFMTLGALFMTLRALFMTLGALFMTRSINVVRMMIISDAIIWSVTYIRHSDYCNISIKQATGKSWCLWWTGAYPSGELFQVSPISYGILALPANIRLGWKGRLGQTLK